jgi:TonB family protein
MLGSSSPKASMTSTSPRFALSVIFLALSALILSPVRSVSQEQSANARKILSRVAPQYPNLARKMRIQGSVKADVLVAPNGSVKSVEIKGGHPLLVQSAQDALHDWKWEPAPHETHEVIELRFSF